MKNTSVWVLTEDRFEPTQQAHHETVFTIGNGYLCTRGSFEEGYPGASPATLLHGVFDDVPIAFTELANAPDWTEIDISLAGERFSLLEGQVLSYSRQLDLSCGVLERQVHWRSPGGNEAHLQFKRFASLADPHVLVLEVTLTPQNFSGEVEVRAGINGAQDTLGLLHWELAGQQTEPGLAVLHLRTRHTQIELGMAFRLHAVGNGWGKAPAVWDVKGHPVLVQRGQVSAGSSVRLEKIVTVFTSRDVPSPVHAARQRLARLACPATPGLLAEHQHVWAQEWERGDVIIEGDADAQLALRFNLYQLLIAAPRQDERVNLGAKTLSGFGYRGHAFWDTEIFMLPYFSYTRPEIARNLLSYRFHNLPGARAKAQRNGCQGAQFPWESAATGEEVTPTWVPHPTDPTQLIRIWTGDIEIHVSADIAYAVWQYWQLSRDEAFLLERGAPLILETARFWATRAEWNPEVERYEFKDVIGPDEYHDHVDNNAYTNYLARWHLGLAETLAAGLEEHHPEPGRRLLERLGVDARERQLWKTVAERITCPWDPETGLIEQFDGYFARQDVDLQQYHDRTQSMQSLLGIEGANATQVLKQPDVLMLLYLLPELADQKTLLANYHYYTPRTDHTFGSSLGPAIQAIMACRMGRADEAYEHFMRAAHADLYDVRGNAGDGIHGASAGGLWQAVVFGFAGLRLQGESWTVQPCLPDGWTRVAFKFMQRGVLQTVDVCR